MSQSKDELDAWYSKPDPWQYQTTPDDIFRKRVILSVLDLYGVRYARALDIGAGEGFITQSLPAAMIQAYELSDTAATRLPDNVKRVTEPIGKYDLILATGVLYSQYDWRGMVDMINQYASGIVLTCSIASWEVSAAWLGIRGKQIFTAEFPYREWNQKLRVIDVRLS